MHTAKCRKCGVLLYYPYPQPATLETKNDERSIATYKDFYREYHTLSSRLNHENFTAMYLFTIEHPERILDRIRILDYGAGTGQFTLICKSFIPWSDIYSVDINDFALLQEYDTSTKQIKWKDFENDTMKFDFIFLNDVFEHLHDCEKVLKTLKDKLDPNGKIFIATPKQFWIHPVLKFLSKNLYGKLLTGTVSISHLQIWSRKSFFYLINQSNLAAEKYSEISQFTMEPDEYLKNMGIKNRIIIILGKLFYRLAGSIARNKIMCVLVNKGPNSND